MRSEGGTIGSDGFGGGGVTVDAGGEVLLDAGEISSRGASAPGANGNGGTVRVGARGALRIVAGKISSEAGGGQGGGGNGGLVDVSAGSISVRGGPAIAEGSSTGSILSFGGSASVGGNAGDIRVTATNGGIDLSHAEVRSEGGGADGRGGSGGNVEVSAGHVVLKDASQIVSVGGAGNVGSDAGDVTVTASGGVQLTGSQVGSAGIGGFAVVAGRGGNVEVSGGSIALEGANPLSAEPSSIYSKSGDAPPENEFDLGVDGGAVTVRAATDLQMSDGATISSTGGAAGTGGAGGPVSVTAGTDLVAGPGAIVSSGAAVPQRAAGGDGGLVMVSAGGELRLAAGATIATVAPAGGFVGDVRVDAHNIVLDGSGSPRDTGIRAEGAVLSAQASNLTVSSDTLSIRGGAAIAAESFGFTPAGSVSIVTRRAELQGGTISVSTFTGGVGGKVDLQADELFLSDGAHISANNFRGAPSGGELNINARYIELSGGSSLDATAGGGLTECLIVQTTFDEGGPVDLFLVSPIGTRIFLNTNADAFGYADESASLTRPFGFLSRIVAADLNGDWTLEVQPNDRTQELVPFLNSWSLSLNDSEIGRSDVPVSGQAFNSVLAVTGARTGLTGGRGGDINIHAEMLTVTGGSSISAGTVGMGAAGNVAVDARQVTVTGGGRIESASLLLEDLIRPGSGILGGAGSISLNAVEKVTLSEGGSMSVSANTGDGGDITVGVNGSLTLQAGNISADAMRAGRISLEAREVRLESGSHISTETRENGTSASDITLRAGNIDITGSSVAASSSGAGRGGSLNLSSEGAISIHQSNLLSENSASGDAGRITVEATGAIALGEGSTVRTTSSSSSGGDITLRSQASTVALEDSNISAEAAVVGGNILLDGRRGLMLSHLGMGAETRGGGSESRGGNIRLQSVDGSVLVSNTQIAATAVGAGAGGDIEVVGGGAFGLTDGSLTTQASGTGGNVSVTTLRGPLVVESSTISAAAGDSGNIHLQAPGNETILVRDSEITAQAQSTGGQITIDPQLVVLDRSQIDGRAGGQDVRVQITADQFIKSTDSAILSDAVTAPVEVDVASALARLSGALAAAQARLEALCGVQFGGHVSSFLITGRGGLPPEPAGLSESITSASTHSSSPRDLPPKTRSSESEKALRTAK
jgi:hypothetical protein